MYTGFTEVTEKSCFFLWFFRERQCHTCTGDGAVSTFADRKYELWRMGDKWSCLGGIAETHGERSSYVVPKKRGIRISEELVPMPYSVAVMAGMRMGPKAKMQTMTAPMIKTVRVFMKSSFGEHDSITVYNPDLPGMVRLLTILP